jgi:hypothetical protein
MRRFLIALLLVLLPGLAVGQDLIKYYPSSTANAEWRPSSPILWDEFLTGSTSSNTVGQLGWYISCTGANSQISVANHPGVHRCTTGVGSAAAGILQNGNIGNIAAELAYYKSIVRIGTGANVPTKRVGYFSALSSPPTHGVYFECLHTDTNWFSVTRENGTESRKDTGIAYNATAWPVFEISHPSSTLWRFSINGALVASHTTGENIPLETREFFFGYVVTDRGTAVTVDIDYLLVQLAVPR